jgi:hypothetical protein
MRALGLAHTEPGRFLERRLQKVHVTARHRKCPLTRAPLVVLTKPVESQERRNDDAESERGV